METVHDFIQRTLPELNRDTVANLVEHLATCGISTKEDCCNSIQSGQLVSHLTTEELFKFLAVCHEGEMLIFTVKIALTFFVLCNTGLTLFGVTLV